MKTLKNKFSWFDQPVEIEQATLLEDNIPLQNALRAELRQRGSIFYITVGGLFGSQTLECSDAIAALVTITTILRAAQSRQENPDGKETFVPPFGAKLMENASGDLQKRRRIESNEV